MRPDVCGARERACAGLCPRGFRVGADGSARTARPSITVTFSSTCAAAIDHASIQMTVDDEAVMPKAEGTGATVTVVYTPPMALVEEEDHTVFVKARDVKGTVGRKPGRFTSAIRIRDKHASEEL